MRRAKCRKVGVYATAGVCLVAALVSIVGCEEKTSKKGALTDLEVRRLTLAQKPDRPDHLIVSGETITWEDVLAFLPEESAATPSLKDRLAAAAKDKSLRQFMEEQWPFVQQKLNSRISSIVLSKRAERDLGSKVEEKLNEFADRELRRFVLEEHGGNGAEADEALQKAGMNRVSYLQWKKKEILAKYLVESKYMHNRPITYREMLERYNERKDKQFVQEGLLQLRLIDIDADKVRAEHPNEDPRQKAEDLRKRVDAGEDFAELAKKYSQGLWREQGGLWRPRDPNALAAPYDVLAKAAQGMERGQVAGPLEVPGHFFIMKVEEKRPRSYRPLSDVQDDVKKDVADGRWGEIVAELDAEIRRQVDLANTSKFVAYCMERFYRQAQGKEEGSLTIDEGVRTPSSTPRQP
jgi:parvulin-like peptidyl-prolyl isomerase